MHRAVIEQQRKLEVEVLAALNSQHPMTVPLTLALKLRYLSGEAVRRSCRSAPPAVRDSVVGDRHRERSPSSTDGA